MTPAQEIKSHGLPSLKYVAGAAGISRGLLTAWHKSRPGLFRIIVLGAASLAANEDKMSRIRRILDE